MPAIRQALKLVLAYNLTKDITFVQQGLDSPLEGHITNVNSKYYKRVVAPVLINFKIKCALAQVWRDLHKEILRELSALYFGLYLRDRRNNWPVKFLLSSILLIVWEEMQFDCHYHILDKLAVDKFCTDMETIPIAAIVCFFHTISQKRPSFTGQNHLTYSISSLRNDVAARDVLIELRSPITKHGMYYTTPHTKRLLYAHSLLTSPIEDYLKTRQDAKFDRCDSSSLSNKFLSKLVLGLCDTNFWEIASYTVYNRDY